MAAPAHSVLEHGSVEDAILIAKQMTSFVLLVSRSRISQPAT